MSLPTDNHTADDRGHRAIETRLRNSADGFPGVLPGGGTLDSIVGRGRRARTVSRASRIGVAGSLLAGVAFASPALLDRGETRPTVLNHVDEEVNRDEGVDAAPVITVLSPRDGSVVASSRITFTGEVDRDADVKVGPFEVEVASDGSWRIDLELVQGRQTFTFWATDAAGNRGFDEVTVTRATAAEDVEPVEEASEEAAPVVVPVAAEPKPEPKPEAKPEPQPAPKTEPKPEPEQEQPKQTSASYAFTAHQRYGSCSEPVPYDEFEGTAQPGSQVWIWSEYGEKTVNVNGDGHWFARVEFPTAPQGKAFQVKTKSLHTGEKIFFEFVNTGDGGSHAGAEAPFTADMENNHVEHDPPYGYWSGTAPAGTTIWVGSEYGAAQTTADAQGNWRTKVWFEDAPYGTHTWQVVVESSNDDRAVFEYTGTRPEPAPKDH